MLCARLARGLETEPQPPTTPPASPDEATSPDQSALQALKHMSLDELMNQDVTSVAREPEPYRHAPAAIQVVTAEDIQRFGAQGIPEALRLADNLEVGQASSSAWNITARGFNGTTANKLLVLMDGRTLYTPLFSGVIWNMQDYLMRDIDRIEVISGPGGTLWGANAVNGVINIITKDARETQGLYTEAGGGNYLEGFGAVRYGGVLSSNVYYRVYGQFFERGPEDFRDGSDAHDWWNRGQAGFRIDSYASPDTHLTLEGDGMGGYNHVVPGGEGTPQSTGSGENGHLLGRYTHVFTEESDLTLQLYYDQTHLFVPFQGFGTNIPAGNLRDTMDIYDLDFQHRFSWGERQHFVWGAGYRFLHDVDFGAPLVEFAPGVWDQNLFSGFMQDEIRLQEHWVLTVGTKLEHNDYTGFEYEPSGRLQWNLSDQQMLWGAVSRAVRTPSRYDRDLFEPTPAYGSLLAGTNIFRSEDVIAYELGYRTELSHSLSGSLSLFYNDYSHVRSLNYSSPGMLPLIWENNLRADTYGLELVSTYEPRPWWRLHAGYDFLREHISIGPGGDINNGLNETADPRNQFFLRSSVDLPWRLELDPAYRWIDTVHNNNGGTPGVVPAYSELDVRLAWHATRRLELAIVGQNLLHDRHPEAGFPGPAQEQIRRSVFGKISYQW